MTAYETVRPAAAADSPADLAQRLVPPMPGSRVWGWAGPLLVTAFGAFLRFYRLGTPKAVVFDETYYVGDAWGILKHGVEINHAANANALLARGSTAIFAKNGGGELVVHPPLGKIMIAVGEWLFGLTPFGWRFAVALIGSLAILMTARIARRMTRSTLLGCIAGLLLSLDGLELVMSRIAILDIFVMFWVLAAFGLLIIDRDQGRARLAKAIAAGVPAEEYGPWLGIRWLRLAAGLCLGLAVASKWNGVWFIPVFALLAFVWDLGARRAAGVSRPWAGAGMDTLLSPIAFIIVPVIAYTASWAGWFASPTSGPYAGYDRNWAALHGNHTPIWASVDSWYQYQKYALTFGLGLTTGHPYKSQPWTWFVLARPVSFYYATPKTCGVLHCSQEVLAIGTPAIWIVSLAVIVALAVLWLSHRDWRAAALLAAITAGWLPWVWFSLHDHRTEFYFYSVAFDPFLIIGITMCLGLIIGPAMAQPFRRALGAVISGVYLLAVLWDFWFTYPVLTAQVMTYTSWLQRMWYHGWI